jgi:hypothetical protein
MSVQNKTQQLGGGEAHRIHACSFQSKMPQYTCPTCSAVTEHVSMRLAARTAKRTRKTVKAWVEKGWVSFQEFPSGRVMICSQCLIKSRKATVAAAQSLR